MLFCVTTKCYLDLKIFISVNYFYNNPKKYELDELMDNSKI
jgi:hypothetical protein